MRGTAPFRPRLVLAGLLVAAAATLSANNAPQLLAPGDRLTSLPVSAVRIKDAFWAPRQETNRTRTLDHVLQQIEATGGLRNFDIAAGKVKGEFGGPFWADSDVYKWLEGASLSLAIHPDPALDAKVDGIIARIADAQEEDGYLNTFIQIAAPELRFRNFAFFHEDFSSGHLFEAAAAHYEATGKKTLLTVATRLADLFDREFGPGRKEYISGHEGIETALVTLSRVTGERRYLELAKVMVDRRGQRPSIFEKQYRELPIDRT
ncbi:MAG TPA: beta-L-arabinofuranosidase domain-containing protein, partial [Vicinamibacterales bacterium]|nr:beta-L-arabinofuranosidase domain-containing protein [Vicinamibacterales bacterium]